MKRPILRIALAASMMTAPLPVVAGGIPVIDAAAIARLALEFGELTEQGASMDTQVGQLAEQIQQGSERFQQLTEQIEQLDTQIAAMTGGRAWVMRAQFFGGTGRIGFHHRGETIRDLG